jgi:hypothetical protein
MAADAENPNPAKPGRGGAEIPMSPLVTRLLGESGEPQDLVTMVGYIGPSKKEAHVRLYTGLDFQTYYEVPREKVALAEAVDREDENSPTRVMIRADATVELVQISKQTGPASYLAGGIAGTYLAGAAASQASFRPPPTHYTICGCWITMSTQCFCTQNLCTHIVPCRQPQEVAEQAIVHLTRYSICNYCPPLTGHSVCVICIPLTRFSICIPCPPPNTLACQVNDPGGPVEAQAQMQPQAAMQTGMAPNLTWPTIYCSYFGGCHPPGTRNCPMAQVGAQPAVLHGSVLCHTPVCTEAPPCTLHRGCPTNYHQLC